MELREAFEVIDTDRDGSIEGKDLQRVLKHLGISFTEAEEETEEMIKVADKSGKGKVNIDEFLSVMSGDHWPLFSQYQYQLGITNNL